MLLKTGSFFYLFYLFNSIPVHVGKFFPEIYTKTPLPDSIQYILRILKYPAVKYGAPSALLAHKAAPGMSFPTIPKGLNNNSPGEKAKKKHPAPSCPAASPAQDKLSPCKGASPAAGRGYNFSRRRHSAFSQPTQNVPVYDSARFPDSQTPTDCHSERSEKSIFQPSPRGDSIISHFDV
jgi:hypothetical protein